MNAHEPDADSFYQESYEDYLAGLEDHDPAAFHTVECRHCGLTATDEEAAGWATDAGLPVLCGQCVMEGD